MMTLDRWIAAAFLVICLAYGWSAWVVMDASLAPFMRRNPIWPSTFPKILAILGAGAAAVVLIQSGPRSTKTDAIDHRRLRDYKLGQAVLLVSLMVAYALALRPVGFIPATILFLVLGAAVLGERRLHWTLLIAAVATGVIWWLVQEVLGIFLRPWPAALGN